MILPRLGRRKVAAVTRADVAELHHELRETPYLANRVVALLSKMFHLAERWGIRPDWSNPCRHVERFREAKRRRFLSSSELARLGRVLSRIERLPAGHENAEPWPAIAAIRLLLFTGCRREEILRLRWDQVDLEGARLELRETKTEPRTVPLAAPALEVLKGILSRRAERELDENPFVLAGRYRGHFVGLSKIWTRIRAGAEIEDLRLHDLRHSYASIAASAGTSLVVIGALLGHTQAATTQRYAHLSDDAHREANDQINREIAAALSAKPPRKNVVRMQPGARSKRRRQRA